MNRTYASFPAQTHNQGFTVLEILVAIGLLSIIALAVSYTQLQAMTLNRNTTSQTNTSVSAQQVIETIRSSWSNSDYYANACAPKVTLPAGYTATFTNLSTRAEPITQANLIAVPANSAPITNVSLGTGCTAASNAKLADGSIPTMRRLFVASSTSVGAQDTLLQMDVLNP